MAETLVELVARISADAAELKKGLSDAERETETSSKKMSNSLKTIGKTMTVSGAAVTAAMSLMGKTAIDEDINIKRLSTTMRNAGKSYDDVQDSLEAVIATTMRKTGVSDNAQRDILNRLILVTKDYDKALELLPIALDLAAAGEMDATTAATYLGKAYLELQDGAKEVTVRFGQASLQFKDMADIQNRVKGSAENLVNPLNVLKESTGDVAETLGTFLIPIIKKVVNTFADVTLAIQSWVKENPELSRGIGILTLGLGGILAVTGGLILSITKLTVLWSAFNLALIASPIGMVAIALTTLGTAAILAANAIDETSEAYQHFAAVTSDTTTSLKGLSPELQKGAKLFSEFMKPEVAKAVEKTAAETKKAIDAIKQAITNLKEEYGDLGNAIKSKGDMARAASQVAKNALSSELDKARESTNIQIGLLSKVYAEKIRLANAEGNAAIKKIQDQIEAIDKQTELEDQELEDRRDRDQLSKLSGKERMDFIREMERKQVLRQRELNKEALRDSIEKVRLDTENKVSALQKELEGKQENERKLFAATEERIKKESTLLDVALENELKRLDFELKAAEKLEIDKLAILDKALADTELKERESYARRLAEARAYNSSVNAMGGSGNRATGGIAVPTPWEPPVYLAAGGIVTQPTLGMVGEAGPEAIIPLNEAMGGVTIQFTQPVFFDREDTMNKFVDMIRKGIQRQDRLRFGSAYSG